MGDTDETIGKARGLLAAGDIGGLVRYLRADGDLLPLGEVARLTAGFARLAGADHLAQAAALAADRGEGTGSEAALVLYGFGYACLDCGLAFLAIRPLERALELAPDMAPALNELVNALEEDGQHARAVAVLEEHEPALGWMNRFQYVYNALMAGDLGKAADGFGRLPEPEEASWVPAREKVRRMLARAEVVRGVTPLDNRDLRGWHYVLTGGVLAGLSPYGFDEGMTGRWCFLNDSLQECAFALRRLRLVLDTAGSAPERVLVLPDRSSRILGVAAAMTLGLPAEDFDPEQPVTRSLVVAYDLNQAGRDVLSALRVRLPGEVLFERATCWTSPPRVPADVSGLLGQTVIAPWGAQLCRRDDGTTGPGPEDGRDVEVIAAEIARAAAEPEAGRVVAPGDLDSDLRGFVAAVTAGACERGGGWLGGNREHVPSAGPVPSSRFA